MTTTVPAVEIETAETTLPIFLRALAAEIEHGAPKPYCIVLNRNTATLQLDWHREMPPAAALRMWAEVLGCTSVRVEHNWGSTGDRYAAEGNLAGFRVEVWNAWSDRPAATAGTATSFLPVAELDRGFDDPPPAPIAATMGTGNVHDDDEESLQFADESEYIESDDEAVEPRQRREQADPQAATVAALLES
jgi:hypothetical protein